MNDQLKETEIAAIRLLSFREHSPFELQQKLLVKQFPDELVEQVIEYCLENDYLSPIRYAQMFVRTKANNGYGEYKIRLALKSQKISQPLIEQAFDSQAFDWFELCESALIKHAKHKDLNDYKLRSKSFRFLQNKGFSLEQIHCAYHAWQAQSHSA